LRGGRKTVSRLSYEETNFAKGEESTRGSSKETNKISLKLQGKLAAEKGKI
jgi:hypothetical protein